ncbi:MAG: precorrin-8X methylmutase [Lachnospiraceae bacterium]|nr:precorrin-8X methylmutase [Lachnospiraceae bacterium]
MKKPEIVLPQDIEKRSFEIIESELKVPIDEEKKPIVKRVIHTTADFSYAETMAFSEGVVDKALEAIRGGANIITDTNMVRAGINKMALGKFGGEVFCYMADEDVAKTAKENGTTRAVASMNKASENGQNCIFAIGNAPTALIRLYELINEGKLMPQLIIGVPVGFVNVVESKELVMSLEVPYIVARGRKGGSNVAAAIANALIYSVNNKNE